MHSGDRLLRDGGDLAQRLLHVSQYRLRHAAVPVGGEHDERRDRESDERELPAVEEEDDRDHEDRHHVLREEDEAVAEEEADGLEVDRRPRHELSGLAAVVEAERQAQKVRVELVAQVVLDGERLPAGDHATSVHQHSAHEPERDDRPDLEREKPPVLTSVELVDDHPGQDGNQDAGHLRGDCEERRDGKRHLVRAQETEQPRERVPAAR